MKRFIVQCLILALLVSCSLDDNNRDYIEDFVPIESVDMPDEFVLGQSYEIIVRYFRPSDCHTFSKFFYRSDLNERLVAVMNYEFLGNNCLELTDELVEVSFNFLVISNETYTFKFWQGEDTDGEGQYLTIEVPVVE